MHANVMSFFGMPQLILNSDYIIFSSNACDGDCQSYCLGRRDALATPVFAVTQTVL